MIVGGDGGGIAEPGTGKHSVLFLEICLTQNWLIFITRSNGPFWSTMPSWKLIGAVVVVDVTATLFCMFGWLSDSGGASMVTIVKVWAFSFGIFCLMAGLYCLLRSNAMVKSATQLPYGTSTMRIKRTQMQSSSDDYSKTQQETGP
ncbi:uncharacterized protein HMPREF1541_08638 [Cyphellophora europaea CBS 101466]|uniref:Uncharacterized protein n=1 Tax=Cyphellophora europaea (strain CBS 101466) TaxID=1220924 RepID=W2RIS2_CYPE1|nr:uncharacterized protein HMPREF1541_08638 [Cyphellophora europaea CBS 101466]ETN36361.1 hypothetical protein HMPREF1541_08638 [Cyphellophora europaea CBS 101466]